jgi:hypothetical protein
MRQPYPLIATILSLLADILTLYILFHHKNLLPDPSYHPVAGYTAYVPTLLSFLFVLSRSIFLFSQKPPAYLHSAAIFCILASLIILSLELDNAGHVLLYISLIAVNMLLSLSLTFLGRKPR